MPLVIHSLGADTHTHTHAHIHTFADRSNAAGVPGLKV